MDEEEDDQVFVKFKRQPWWERGEFSLSPGTGTDHDGEELGQEVSKEMAEDIQESESFKVDDYRTPGLLSVYKTVKAPICQDGPELELRGRPAAGLIDNKISKENTNEDVNLEDRNWGKEIITKEDDTACGDISLQREDYKSDGLRKVFRSATLPFVVAGMEFNLASSNGENSAEKAGGPAPVMLKEKVRSAEDAISMDDLGSESISREDEEDDTKRDVVEDSIPDGIEDSNSGKPTADYKSSGLMNVYRSATVPIEVGCLRLTLEKSEDSSSKTSPTDSVRVDWHNDHPGSTSHSTRVRPPPINSSSSAGMVNSARASAVIRRRQKRGSRLRNPVYRINCLSSVLSALYFTGFSPYRPKTEWQPPKYVTLLLKVEVTYGRISHASQPEKMKPLSERRPSGEQRNTTSNGKST